MPLPDERPRGSVANLIGKFEQQSKRASVTAAPPTAGASSLGISTNAPRKSAALPDPELLNGLAKGKIEKIEGPKEEALSGAALVPLPETPVDAKPVAPPKVAPGSRSGTLSASTSGKSIPAVEQPATPISQPAAPSDSAEATVSPPPTAPASLPTSSATPSKPPSHSRDPLTRTSTIPKPAQSTAATKRPSPAAAVPTTVHKSRIGRPESRSAATPSPVPSRSNTASLPRPASTQRTVPSTALHAPTASSLAKARQPAAAAAATPTPPTRRLSTNKKETGTPPSIPTPARSVKSLLTAGAKPGESKGVVAPLSSGTRGRVKPRIGLAGGSLRRPATAPTAEAEILSQPGGDPATSEAVAAEELHLIVSEDAPDILPDEEPTRDAESHPEMEHLEEEATSGEGGVAGEYPAEAAPDEELEEYHENHGEAEPITEEPEEEMLQEVVQEEHEEPGEVTDGHIQIGHEAGVDDHIEDVHLDKELPPPPSETTEEVVHHEPENVSKPHDSAALAGGSAHGETATVSEGLNEEDIPDIDEE